MKTAIYIIIGVVTFLFYAETKAEIVMLKSGDKLEGNIIITYNKGLLFREKEGATGRYFPYNEVSRISTKDGRLYYLMPRKSKAKKKKGLGFFPFARVILPSKKEAVPIPYITPPGGEAVEAVCTGAVDPVTIQLKGGVNIRLLGLSPPPEEAGAKIFLKAVDSLSKRLKDKKVLLFPGPQNPRDKETPAAYVVAENVFLNADLLQNGLASTSPMPKNHPYSQAFTSLEKYAKNLKYGLWANISE